MSADRALKNIHRMKDMRVTGDEANWLLGVLAGTTEMTSALTLLQGHRERHIAVETTDRLVEVFTEQRKEES